jgi:uncharacterized membrane protein YedE/YeeE
MDHFTPTAALLGGALIGLAATILAAVNGRVAGITGILDGFLRPAPGDWNWRTAFLAGLLGGAFAVLRWFPGALVEPIRPLGTLAVAGLLVGFGTRLGNGCTSGHGVCGLSRLSPRSLVATVTFIAAGIVTATVIRLLGGAR